jgi:hypothetical protein
MILAPKPLLLVVETSFNIARHRSDAIVIVVVGCVLAAIAPFDTAFVDRLDDNPPHRDPGCRQDGPRHPPAGRKCRSRHGAYGL